MAQHDDQKESSVADKQSDGVPTKPKGISPSLIIVFVIVALFGGVLLAKTANRASPPPVATAADAATETVTHPTGTTMTSTHNDAVADYAAALKTGKPIYLLFHSLTCVPCVEISAVVDRVMPGYEDRVVFVNAISDDPSAQQLASRFQFQYIPTSFFITSDGTVSDSFTGAMSEADMKARLDKLITQ